MDNKYGEEKLNSRLMARFTFPPVRVPDAKLMDEEIKALFCLNSLSIPLIGRGICEVFARNINSF